MRNQVMYDRENNIEYIYYMNAVQSYPMHTHAEHITLCYVVEGAVRIVFDGQEGLYHAGGCFCIMPDISHALEPVNDTGYSMISVCIPADKVPDEPENEISYSKRLKQIILNAPENVFLIEDMAKSIGISPYHMIRQFKAVCGLTPHQFQIQCRVRKAQFLLEEGKSVTEAAYATGFCDQSHFDRCFRKIVRLTPSEYKQAAAK
ncbi:MAG: AraC family transcriptional regulator [Lachnospiraceae bacterium]|nr:AraC family transcriptional regulator [Lachnospiraceae bacterium]